MIQIPTTIEEATGRLTDLGSLANASEWERAAIVYAFTYQATPGKPVTVKNFTVTSFANRGIVGLSSRPTVTYYRKRWMDLVQAALAPDLRPGDSFEIPHVAWAPEKADAEDQAYWKTVEAAISTLLNARQDIESEERIPPAHIAFMLNMLFMAKDVDWDDELGKLTGHVQ